MAFDSRESPSDERPILEPDNLLHGRFTSDPDADASMSEKRAVRCAWAGLVASVAWIFGLGSVFGIGLGAAALIALPSYGRPTERRVAVTATALGFIGLIAAFVVMAHAT